MPKKEGYDAYKISDTGNWNVAADYVKFKIMKFLYITDELEIICEFGHSDILDELVFPIDVNKKKIVAFKRLVKYLSMLINNTQFAIKKSEDVKAWKKHDERLKKIKEITPTLFSIKGNQITKTSVVKIDEEKFEKVLEIVVEIKASMNEPLNNANLIFTPSEEFDAKAYKEKLLEDAKNLG